MAKIQHSESNLTVNQTIEIPEGKIVFNTDDLKIRPLELAETLPSKWYINPAMYKIDQKAIISKTWQYIGSVSQINNAGDYLICEVAGNPVIIINDSGTYRAYYNVCRHRAGPLADKNGNCKVFKCKYHGWTYDLKGKILGTPEFDGVQDFDKNKFSLKEIKVEIWQNLLFINLDSDSVSLASVFSGISERISPIDLSQKQFVSRVEYNINCNWKIYVDNYLEGYHLIHVHPELNDLLDYKNYITETFEFYSLQFSPFTAGDNLYSKDNGEAFYYFVSPNFMLNILPGRLQTNLVIPVSDNQTKVIFDYYYDEIDSDAARELIAADLSYSDIVQQQDISICEAVHKGNASDCYDKGRLSVKREKGLYHFHNLVRKYYSGFLQENYQV